MKTRYTALSTEQKLALTSEDLDVAIQLEAAERGIPIPITFSEAINQMGYVGYSIPANAVAFYELMAPGRYHQSRTGICFKTEEEAQRALEGAISVVEEGYNESKKNTICSGDFNVQKVFVNHAKGKSSMEGIKQYEEEREPYQNLCDELMEELRIHRQTAYDDRVIAEKRAKYLQLANGDEATAERFWNNLEKNQWPTAEKKASDDEITDVIF